MPGWNNLESAKSIHAFFEIGALIFFALLVWFEVLVHRHTKREHLFTLLALISFAVAIVAEICAFPYSRRVEKLSSDEINVLSTKFAESENARSNLLAAASNAQASAAEARELTSSRHITPQMRDKFLALVKEAPKGRVFFCIADGTRESQGFASELMSLLHLAGYIVPGDPQNPNSFNRIAATTLTPYSEVEIGISAPNDTAPFVTLLAKALKDINIDVALVTNPQSRPDFSLITVWPKQLK
jgi:hypothetical protein